MNGAIQLVKHTCFPTFSEILQLSDKKLCSFYVFLTTHYCSQAADLAQVLIVKKVNIWICAYRLYRKKQRQKSRYADTVKINCTKEVKYTLNGFH